MNSPPEGVLTRRPPGHLEYGYFYDITWYAEHAEPEEDEIVDGTIVVTDTTKRLEVDMVSGTKTQGPSLSPECPQHADIWRPELYEDLQVELRGEGSADGLVYCWEEGYQLIGDPLLRKILVAGLTGIRASDVSIEGEPPGEVWQIAGTTRAWAGLCIIPEQANVCAKCGAPLVCPVCCFMKRDDEWNYVCSSCGDIWQFRDASSANSQSTRIRPERLYSDAYVVGEKWDGCDFSYGPVTARVVEFLREVRCGSFYAEPIAVDVAGMNPGQLRHLERVRRL